MTGALIHVRLDGDDAIAAALQRLVARTENMPTDEIAEILGQSTRERFQTGTDPEGKPWKPLAEATIARKRKRKRPLKILIDGGQLMMIVQRATPTEAIVGTNRIYGAMHQFGGTITQYARSQVQKVTKRGRFARSSSKATARRRITIGEHSIVIPARPYLGVSTLDRTRILEAVTDHLAPNAD